MPESQAPATPPKLRAGLIISQQEAKGETFFVFKDPNTSRFFRFGEVEHFIAQQLDGSTPLDSVRQRVQTRFNSPLALDTLEGFVQSLRRLGLLESEGRENRSMVRGPIRGSLLYMRFKAFDPDRFLSFLAARVRSCFGSQFLAFSAVVIVLALAVTILNWNDIAKDVRALWRFEAFFLAWFTVLFVTALHEVAHGATCKHFGGQVHEMGFMLIYFQPAFYCNVSDAWLFPNKSHRLWVTFAGAWFEIFIWGLATLTWRLVERDTWLSFVALVVMATSGIKEAFNLNPLIKLDGYYLLSDYLEIPNLRQKAFRYVGASVRRLWGSAIERIQPPTRRESYIYLIYGLLAVVYSYWLLGWISLRFGEYLVGRYQGFGFFLFAGLLMITFQNPLARALPKLTGRFESQRRRLPGIRRGLKFMIPMALVLVLLFASMELKVAGEFNVLPGQNADVRSEVEGIIGDIYVDEGDQVEKGDLLARLSEADYQTERSKTQAEIDEKRATLHMLQAGARPEEVELANREMKTAQTRYEHAQQQLAEAQRIHATRLVKAETTVKTLEAQLQYARNDLIRLEALFKTGIISQKQREDSQELVGLREKELEGARAEWRMVAESDLAEMRKEEAVAEKTVEEAEGKLKLLRAGSRRETIEAMQAEIVQLETQERYLTRQIQLTRIVSPVDGVITSAKP